MSSYSLGRFSVPNAMQENEVVQFYRGEKSSYMATLRSVRQANKEWDFRDAAGLKSVL